MRLIKLINEENRPLVIIMSIVAISICLLIAIGYPRDIHVKYNGIKYQAGNTASAEPITIEINGRFWYGFLGEEDKFEGQIKIGDLVLNYFNWQLHFDKYKSASLDLDDYMSLSTYGKIFMSNKFEKFTILVYEQVGYGEASWSSGDGWLISAPCNSRDEAVKLTNEMLPKHHGVIK